MKKLATLLNIILCFELMLMPLDLGLFSITSVEASSCAQGMQWDARLGRCLTDVETAKVMQATAKCEPKDVECYKKNAQSAFDKEVAGDSSLKEKKSNKFMSTIGNAGAISAAAYSAYSLLKKTNSKCAKISHGLIIAGGATAFIGELYANQKHKKNLKDIEKDWKKITNTGHDGQDRDSQKVHATAAQSEAFEMLARVEDSTAKNAKTKSTIHAIAAAAFGAAAVVALTEHFSQDGGICPKSSPSTTRIDSFDFLKSENYYQLEMTQFLSEVRKTQYITSGILKDNLASHLVVMSSPLYDISPEIKFFNEIDNSLLEEKTSRDLVSIIKLAASQFTLFPNAHAQEPATTTIMSKGKEFLGGLGESIENFLSQPHGRATLAGILTGWALIMHKHTKSQNEASTNRAKKLREMKAEFAGAAGVVNMCTPDDRSNTSKPECYCYTPDGQRNPSRGNSQICQKLWSGELASAKSYKASQDGFTGCVNASNNYDASCACKKSSKGCLTVSTKGITGIGTGGLSLLNSGVSPLVDMANGNFAKAQAAESGSVNNAMRLLDAAEKMSNQPELRDLKKKMDKAGLKLQNDLIKAANQGGAPQLADRNSFNPGNIQDAVSMLEKQLKDPEQKINEAKNPQKVSAGTSTKKAPSFDFNFATEDASSVNDQVAEVMGQQFDYAQNDINQSQTNLFELLSNRYQRSGLRRLFDEEGKTSPDAPSTTDINN